MDTLVRFVKVSNQGALCFLNVLYHHAFKTKVLYRYQRFNLFNANNSKFSLQVVCLESHSKFATLWHLVRGQILSSSPASKLRTFDR